MMYPTDTVLSDGIPKPPQGARKPKKAKAPTKLKKPPMTVMSPLPPE
jgi:hypothetical protein